MPGFRVAALAAAALLTMASAATAHHSFSMFDLEHPITISGVVKEWRWTNPHTWLTVTVANGKQQPVDWELEGASISVLRGKGWARTSFAAGDKVTVQIMPRRDKSPGGAVVTLTLANGTKLFGGLASGGPAGTETKLPD